MKKISFLIIVGLVSFFGFGVSARADSAYCYYGSPIKFYVEISNSSATIKSYDTKYSIANGLAIPRNEFIKNGKVICLDQLYYATSKTMKNQWIVALTSSGSTANTNSDLQNELDKNSVFNSGDSSNDSTGNVSYSKLSRNTKASNLNGVKNDSFFNTSAKDNEKAARNDPGISSKNPATASSNTSNSGSAGTTSYETYDFCVGEMQKSLRFIGYIFQVLKILIPAIIIIFGVIDFSKAIFSSKEEAIKKAAGSFATRLLVGVLIFLLPTLLNAIFNIVYGYAANASKLENCTTCLFTPGKCEIIERVSSDGSNNSGGGR